MKFLASDSLKGRGNFSPELNKAADYIAKRFEQIGLQPLTGNSFLQPFALYKLMPAQLDVKINQQVISPNKMAFVSHQALWKVDNLTNISIHYITEADNFRSKLLELNQQGGQHLVIVSEKHEAIFSRFQQYFSHGLIKSQLDPDSSLLVVMSDDFPSVQSINIKANTSITAFNINNVVGVLPAAMQSLQPHEQVVFSAHYDHLGEHANSTTDTIYNGADDDGSGTVALLEIAQAFKKAADAGNGPERSIIFLHVTGEEKGLLGSQYYTDIEPLVPLANTVADLNIDMIGRTDPKREGDRNYIYLIGSDKLSTELHQISEEVNKKYTNIEFDYTYNDENDPNRFYYRSDHYNFAKNNIPIIFYFNGTHDDYHKVSDTPDKIEYDLLENRARLVFYTAWELANRPTRIVADKAVNKTTEN